MTFRTVFSIGLILGAACKGQQSAAPDSGSSQEPGITRQQADDILKELREIRQLLEKQGRPNGPSQVPPMQQVPQTGKMRLEGGFSMGSDDAPLTIVEFTDYQCPYCRLFESTTFAEIRKRYVETGQVRFVTRDFPLVAAHPDAMGAAEAAHCAGDQGEFWPMHDALFGDPGNLGRKGLIDHAEALKLDVEVFRSCLESGKHKADIQKDLQLGASLQINGTPAFLIGKAKGDELSGAIVIGAEPLSVFEAKLKEAETAH